MTFPPPVGGGTGRGLKRNMNIYRNFHSSDFELILIPVKILALDLGTKHTGVAFIDQENVGFVVPLPTINHKSNEEFMHAVQTLITDRKIDRIIVGLPFLLSGKEGSQAALVQKRVKDVETLGIPISLVDERYSSRQTSTATHPKKGRDRSAVDPNAMAAIAILEAFIES